MEMEDRISNLPGEVTDKILSYLPIKDAARTSVLSSKWRCKSATLPNLVFNDQCVSTENHTTFARIVDNVLLGHIGPIRKFSLSLRVHKLASRDIDPWILHLSRNSVKVFILNLWIGHRYNIPSCLFSCQDITLLWLGNCSLKTPSTFQGFRSLKTLCIRFVILTQDVFENLIVCCPLLGRLVMVHCDGFTHLKIDAQNLLFLDVKGVFRDVSLENTSKLNDVSICLTDNVANDRRLARGSSSNLLKFFVHLPRVQRLHINNYFLKYLAVGVLPRELPKPCLYLKFLSIHISFKDVKEILTALCLLKSSPALREVEILACQEDQPVVGKGSSWLDDNRNCQFTQLRFVKLTGISGVEAEVDFIRFLLSSSPVLERMTVKPANDFPQLLKKLLQFRRASVDAEVFYLDP